jgi:HlyD family secretion protein
MKRGVLVALAAVVLAVAVFFWLRHGRGPAYFTGFVEGEERVLRSEVAARILEVRFGEGGAVRPNEPVAILDDRDVLAKLETKRREVAMLDADIGRLEDRAELVASTWTRDRSARSADLRQAESAADLAEKNLAREKALVETGASTRQELDETNARRDEAASALERARQMVGRADAEERSIAVAKRELEASRRRRELAEAEIAELEVLHSKYVVRSPNVPTVVQTQFAWPGELAQPGTALVSVLDPNDKYVQIYVPVAELGHVRVGRSVAIELDSQPGRRFPGAISFIADQASFTPEKIETRSDRMGQVYRAKVRILEGAEELRPGTEGNVYLVADRAHASDRAEAAQ